jgi:hypothetical protein
VWSAGLHWILWSSFTAMASVFAIVGIVRLRAALSSPRRSAYRWHVPALRWSPGDVIASGPIGGEPLATAPITGRPAIAWRVEVRYEGDAPDELALVEQSCPTAVVVGAFAVTQPTIAIAAERVPVDSPEAQIYLRSRGVDPHDALEVREMVVQPGEPVVFRRDELGGSPVLERAS